MVANRFEIPRPGLDAVLGGGINRPGQDAGVRQMRGDRFLDVDDLNPHFQGGHVGVLIDDGDFEGNAGKIGGENARSDDPRVLWIVDGHDPDDAKTIDMVIRGDDP